MAMDDFDAPVFEDNDFGDLRDDGGFDILPDIQPRGPALASREAKNARTFSDMLPPRKETAASTRSDSTLSSRPRTGSRPRTDFSDGIASTGALAPLGEPAGDGDARQRIMQLSKKNRELTAALGGEQARSKKLMARISELEKQTQTMENDIGQAKRASARLQAQVMELTMGGGTQAAMAVPEAKIEAKEMDTTGRSEVHQLKKDLQLAVKALARELGDEVPVARVLANPTDWKGRAEQIALLKAKVAELQKAKPGSRTGTSRPSPTPRDDAGDRNKAALRTLEAQRKAMLEQASAECEQVKQAYTELQQKHDALKARNANLSRELKTAKTEADALRMQLSDGEAQQRALREQIARARSETPGSRLGSRGVGGGDDTDAMAALAKVTAKCRDQRLVIARLEARIRELEERAPVDGAARTSRPSSRAGAGPTGAGAATLVGVMQDRMHARALV
eukprot:m.58558 g.58558  ORF g.58558 m.58558 type:complete len:452 (-) comp6912_c0_seq2:916-2271(-)